MDDENELKAASERLRLAFDLYEAGEAMMRQNLKREFPTASAAEIETRLVAWLQEERPGSEHGDGIGRPGSWPRRSE
jgi:hypothetical protein